MKKTTLKILKKYRSQNSTQTWASVKVAILKSLHILSMCFGSYLFFLGIAGAQALNLATPETRLEKLSRALRGLPASQEEKQDLRKALSENQESEFFKKVTRSYLASPFFEGKLKRNIDELYRFQIDPRLLFEYDSLQYHEYEKMKQFSPSSSLVRKVIHDNLSWDELILHKNYDFFYLDSESSFQTSDKTFFDALAGIPEASQPRKRTLEEILQGLARNGDPFEGPYKKAQYSFGPADPRVAGLLTTPRFLERYVNTALNKNRKRAAALFRTLLCDPMVAAIPSPSADKDLQDLDLVFPAHREGQSFTEEQIRKNIQAPDLHGTQADCRACHDKLDPVGQVFAFSARAASSTPSPGALSYRSRAGAKIFIPVSGVGDLAQKITEQKDYVACQVKHFWRWYIGQDVPLTEKKENELIEVFNRVGRKPQDFIQYLVQSQEFNQKPQLLTEEQLLARRAARVMKNCNSCHVQKDVLLMADWDLTEFPYSPDPAGREMMVNQLKEVLDTRNGGLKKSMPPRQSNWRLNPDDFLILQKWLHSGAPDYAGEKQVREEPL